VALGVTHLVELFDILKSYPANLYQNITSKFDRI